MNIEEKIHLIQNTFQKAKANTSLEDFNVGLSILNLETPGEYASVVYEGTSTVIALESFKNTNSIAEWLPFYECFRASHSSQMLVGLGWALFESGQQLAPTLDQLEPRQIWRVLDGYGFCHGLFKRNSSIRQQLIPKELDLSWIGGYTQGLGRSLWYISRGNIEHLVRMIFLFPAVFHSDLWRGVGIAVTFVGGANEQILSDLRREVKSNLPSLKCGIALALHSREKAHSYSEDAVLTGNFFLSNIEIAIRKIETLELKKCDSTREYNEMLNDIEI